MRSLLFTLLLISPAMAEEPVVPLKPGPGVELLAQNCAACHSADYIRTNAPFLSADAWKAEVTKMRAGYGAPVDDEDSAKIISYLVTNYGPKN